MGKKTFKKYLNNPKQPVFFVDGRGDFKQQFPIWMIWNHHPIDSQPVKNRGCLGYQVPQRWGFKDILEFFTPKLREKLIQLNLIETWWISVAYFPKGLKLTN